MICTLCLLAFVLLLILVFLFWIRNYGYWESQNVPSIPAKFPFGSFRRAFTLEVPIFQVVADAYDHFKDAPLVGMYGPTQPVLLVRDPTLVKQVLVDNFNDFADPGFEVYPSVDPLLGLNPFCTPGNKWKEVRSVHTPVFTFNKIKGLMQEINSSADKLINHIRQKRNGIVNLIPATKMFLIDAVAKSAYGIDSKVWEDPSHLVHHMVRNGVITSPFEANMSAVCSILIPWLNLITRFKLISTKAHDLMKQIYNVVVPVRRTSESDRYNSLQHLIDVENKLRFNGKKGFSSAEWAAHLMVFFLDGTETAGLALSFTIFLLSQKPEVRKKMRQEILDKGITMDNLHLESVRSLEYMEMVLQECLRKLPPLPILTRKSTKEISLGGIRVSKGMKIIVPAMKLQNDPKHYRNPEGFDPERFSSERKSEVRKGTYFPFGDGPRICVGMNYAKTSIKVGLIALLLEFDWTAGPSHTTFETENNSTFFLFPKNGLLEVKFIPLVSKEHSL